MWCTSKIRLWRNYVLGFCSRRRWQLLRHRVQLIKSEWSEREEIQFQTSPLDQLYQNALLLKCLPLFQNLIAHLPSSFSHVTILLSRQPFQHRKAGLITGLALGGKFRKTQETQRFEGPNLRRPGGMDNIRHNTLSLNCSCWGLNHSLKKSLKKCKVITSKKICNCLEIKIKKY